MDACTTTAASKSADMTKNQVQAGKPETPTIKKDVFFYNQQNGQYYANREAKFSLRATDKNKSLDHIEVSLDNGSFERYINQIQFTTEGPHLLRFRSQDPFSNWSPVQTMKIQVDLTPPEVKPYWAGVTETVDGKLYVRPDAVLKFDAHDSLSGVAKIFFKKSLSDPAETAPEQLSFKQAGSHKIFVCAADNVGNVADWQTIDFIVGNDAPQTTFQVNGASKTNAGTTYVNADARIELKAGGASSGIKQIEYRMGEGPVQIYQHPIAITDKTMNLHYRAMDNLDNKEEWKTAKFARDTQGPAIKVTEKGRTLREHGIIYAKPGLTLALEVSDEQSGVQKLLVARDQTGFQETKQNSFVFNNPGIQHFAVQAFDNLGNMAESEMVSIFIDSDVGQSKLKTKKELIPQGNLFLSELPNSIDIVAGNSGVGIDYIEYSYDGKNFQRLKGSIDLGAWKREQETLYYHSVDKLGNVEQTQQITIKVQAAPPTVDIFVDSSQKPDVPLSDLTKAPSHEPEKAQPKKAHSH